MTNPALIRMVDSWRQRIVERGESRRSIRQSRPTGMLVAFGLALLLLAPSLSAQVQVDIGFKRTLYMRYEPIICTVTITNLSARTLELADTLQEKWFSFQIENTDGRLLPPLNMSYTNQPVQIPAGQKLTRSINLTPLYPLSEFGTYRVRAAVFLPELGRYFASSNLNIDITEGRELWRQTVGIAPGSGSGATRTYTILAHRLPATTMLYLRVEDRDAGVVYCTTQLGRFITFGKPDVEIDAASHIHILQNTAPKAFLYSHFDTNGKVIKQQAYQVMDTRPALVKRDNQIEVLGGVPFNPNVKTPEQNLPKMSDRPVALPTPQGQATPQEKRPENLLSR